MEALAVNTPAHTPRRIGVVLAGVGGVGVAFARVLQQRFCTPEREVVIVAIGDSSGFVCPCSTAAEAFSWEDVDGILTHKTRGHPVSSWATGGASASPLGLKALKETLWHVHTRRGLDDYAVVDCTSSATTTAALIQAKNFGFAVILANKLPVAGSLDEYRQLIGDPSHPSRRVRYEATVGAGIPAVSVLQRLIASRDSITMVQGGLSGTMTYILSAMNRGMKFSTALQEVKHLGITEADPREDLSGADVARKMVILAREMGFNVEAGDVEITLLLPASAFELPVETFLSSLRNYDAEFDEQLRAAKSQGCALAYIGTIDSNGNIRIGLQRVSPLSAFATASSTEGVIAIHSEWFPEPLALRGTGAGAASTAAAVAGDLATILCHSKR